MEVGSGISFRVKVFMVVFAIFMIAFGGVCEGQNLPVGERVETAVRLQMVKYPKSRLIDYYKNFFQDKFGPGHIISDTTSAGRYLRMELVQMNAEGDLQINDLVELTGWEHTFARVNLAAVKTGKIKYSQLLEELAKSAAEAPAVSIAEWIKEWSYIEKIIMSLNSGLEGAVEDSVKIRQMLARGEFAVHHSEIYNQEYKPHYRLIKRELLTSMPF
jgi:hypothetical protein